MLLSKPLMLGKLSGTIYDFEKTGDELELHVHTEADVHISIVARGSIRAFGPGWEQIVETGAVMDWEPGQAHGFVALEDNSRLVNIIKA